MITSDYIKLHEAKWLSSHSEVCDNESWTHASTQYVIAHFKFWPPKTMEHREVGSMKACCTFVFQVGNESVGWSYLTYGY